jgi:hypothetical protein
MFWIVKYGEGPENCEYNESLGPQLQDLLKNHKDNFTCTKKNPKKVFMEERKDIIRNFFLENQIYIPNTRPLIDEFNYYSTQWNDFTENLMRDNVSVLNTLSLIVEMNSDIASHFDLKKINSILEESHECINFSPTNAGNKKNVTTAFGNVIEFYVTVQSDSDPNDFHNASVKLWNDLKIHVCGCRTINSALRISSCIIRILRQLHGDLTLRNVKPSFANASFDFFPYEIRIQKLHSLMFLDGLRKKLSDTTIQVNLQHDVANSENVQNVSFLFSVPYEDDTTKNKTTTIKIYPHGNIVITVNNFDGLLLQKALQVLQRVAEEQNVFMSNIQTNIVIDFEEDTTSFFSPLSSSGSHKRSLLQSPLVNSSVKRAKFF